MTGLRYVVRPGPALRQNGAVSIDYSTGKLLVATPRTVGEIFWRSVVLVLQHDEGGAQGVVLNRPLTAPVSAVLPDWQDYVTDPPTVFQGGPVAMDSALGLVTVPGDKQEEPLGVRLLFGGIGIVDLDIPPVVVMRAVAGLRIRRVVRGSARAGDPRWRLVCRGVRGARRFQPRAGDVVDHRAASTAWQSRPGRVLP